MALGPSTLIQILAGLGLVVAVAVLVTPGLAGRRRLLLRPACRPRRDRSGRTGRPRTGTPDRRSDLDRAQVRPRQPRSEPRGAAAPAGTRGSTRSPSSAPTPTSSAAASSSWRRSVTDRSPRCASCVSAIRCASSAPAACARRLASVPILNLLTPLLCDRASRAGGRSRWYAGRLPAPVQPLVL